MVREKGMKMPSGMEARTTMTEKLLLTAAKLPGIVVHETLVVEAWKAYPETFGLKGYSSLYPDANTVAACLSATGGPKRKGWLEVLSPRVYNVTDAGRRHAARLRREKPEERSGALAADLDRELRLLLKRTPPAEPTFADACHWWNIDALTVGNFDCVKALLDYALEEMDGRSVTLESGQYVTPDDIAKLQELDAALRTRFASHLRLLANRGKKACIQSAT